MESETTPLLTTPAHDASLPGSAHFTPAQWQTMLTIADTLIPALTPSEITSVSDTLSETYNISASSPEIQHYLTTSCLTSPAFLSYLSLLLTRRPRAARSLARLLSLLSRGGLLTWMLTYSTTPFPELPRAQREAVLQGWRGAHLRMFRELFQGLKQAVAFAHLRQCDTALAAMKYVRGVPAAVRPEFYQFGFAAPPAEAVMEADVVIVGSGAGGGVVAARLLADVPGLRVVVVERGEWIPNDQFPLAQGAYGRFLAGGGGVMTEGGGVRVLAGNTWGGGTTVNYGASLQLPWEVREEWRRTYGLSWATGREFQECLDHVCNRMGVSTAHITHDTCNTLLLRGSHLTGQPTTIVPQNSGNTSHACGYCCFGCPTATKQGTAATFLADAALAGATLLHGTTVERLLFSGSSATGVLARTSTGAPLRITAPRVILAAGTLATPPLLHASGLRHPSLGQGVHLHPSLTLHATLPTPTNPTQGPILTAIITPPGSKVAAIPNHPGLTGPMAPWTSAAAWRAQALSYPNSVAACVIVRDSSRGRITPKGRIHYAVEQADRDAALTGLLAAARAFAAAGARTVAPDVERLPAWVDDGEGVDGVAFALWEYKVRREWSRGGHEGAGGEGWVSAHQMGGAAMGAGGGKSVCDEIGRVRGWRGVWVADASSLPSATGVNPMVSTMAVAEFLAREIAWGINFDRVGEKE
ncbi:hypothetical protein EDC01DRAFT_621566 [Geopyxis carbonaria]|nr:hypothetical protein EDC01DRAFT_621566 [Geopyxis carbonaria]